MKSRFLAIVLCAISCLLVATGCGNHTKPSTATPTAAGPSTPPPNPTAIASKVIADLQSMPPGQRGRYVALHHNEFMVAMMNPNTRSQVQSLLSQH